VTTLGVSCTSSTAYLAAADGDMVAETPDRLEFGAGLSPADKLLTFADDVARAIRDSGAAHAVVLQAEATYEAGHTAWTVRVAMETLLRLECARAGVSCSYISRQAVKGAFGLKGKGSLDKLGKDELVPAGKYWTAGRLVAALAAAAAERKA
jgi:hypothetical protein